MRETKRIMLADMKQNLQARMQYKNPDKAFNDLLIGYGHFSKHATGWAGGVRRKGWMSPYIARRFAQYCGYPIDQN